MRLNSLARSFGFRTFAVVAALTLLVIGARPSAGRSVPPQGGIVIQVRDVPTAPIVEIVAWNAATPAYGLRTWVRRSGGVQDRYHRIWVSRDANPGSAEVTKAQGLDRPLPVTSTTDTENCLNGKCSPGTTIGARMPDGALRSSKDDVAVKFIRDSGGDFSITLRRGLVDAYLVTVDSVVTALKK
jgi:hypothetical protein